MDKLGRRYELTIFPAVFLQRNGKGDVSFYSPNALSTATNLSLANILDTTVQGVNSALGLSNKNDVIQITNPFTLQFNIERKALASVNTGSFRIFNLNEDTRNRLYKDYTNYLCRRRIVLRAGYSDPLPVIFSGNVMWCTSHRKGGHTNFVTEIEAQDWSFAVTNSYSNWNSGPISKQRVVDQLIKDMSNLGVSRGYVRTYDEQYSKLVVSGDTWEILKRETQGACHIDNGKVHVLNEDDCFSGTFNEISSKTGLLGSPKKSESLVIADMIFEPTLQISQMVNLRTESQSMFNGSYKVVGLNHSGTISDAVDGECQTTVSLFNFIKNGQIIQNTLSTV